MKQQGTQKKMRKTLQELTIKDNFMFGAVMIDEENCRRCLELVLGFPMNCLKKCEKHSETRSREESRIRSDRNLCFQYRRKFRMM